jgi:hypothetical protein
MTKGGLGKCDSIVGLRVEAGRGSRLDCCSEWVKGKHEMLIGEGAEVATNLEYELYGKKEIGAGPKGECWQRNLKSSCAEKSAVRNGILIHRGTSGNIWQVLTGRDEEGLKPILAFRLFLWVLNAWGEPEGGDFWWE